MSASSKLITFMPSYQNPFPPRYRTKLHIAAVGDITGAVAEGPYQMGGNTLVFPLDPHGHSTPYTTLPNSLVNLSALNCVGQSNLLGSQGPYSHYRVFGSMCKITLMQNSTDTNPIMATLIPMSDQSAFPTSAVEAESLPYAKSILFNPYHGRGTLKSFMPCTKIFGITKTTLNIDSSIFSALYGQYPSRQFYWHLMLDATDGTTDVSVGYKVDMTYYVELFSENTGSLLQD